MFSQLEIIFARPRPFEFYNAADLWTDEHISKQMLAFHLNEAIDVSSRNKEFIDRSVDWIAGHFQLTSETAVADFGCGPGLYAHRLASKGARVTGIDFSSRSIKYARQRARDDGLDIEYHCQDYLDFETDQKFDLILMIMCDFCALSPAQRKLMLTKFVRLLKPQGSILLDAYSLSGFDQRKESASCEHNSMNGFWSRNDYYGFQNTFKYEAEKVVLDKYTIIETEKVRTIYNWLEYFSPASLETEFEQCGLKIESSFADVAGTPFNSENTEFAIAANNISQ